VILRILKSWAQRQKQLEDTIDNDVEKELNSSKQEIATLHVRGPTNENNANGGIDATYTEQLVWLECLDREVY
jgi:hypothetical protein